MPGYSTPIKPPVTQDKSVINLSPTFIPGDRHQKLLQKGLSFIPTPPINNQRQSLMAHLSSNHRRPKLHSYFEGRTIKERTPFPPKSTWEPNSADLQDTLLTLFQKEKHITEHTTNTRKKQPIGRRKTSFNGVRTQYLSCYQTGG